MQLGKQILFLLLFLLSITMLWSMLCKSVLLRVRWWRRRWVRLRSGLQVQRRRHGSSSRGECLPSALLPQLPFVALGQQRRLRRGPAVAAPLLAAGVGRRPAAAWQSPLLPPVLPRGSARPGLLRRHARRCPSQRCRTLLLHHAYPCRRGCRLDAAPAALRAGQHVGDAAIAAGGGRGLGKASGPEIDQADVERLRQVLAQQSSGRRDQRIHLLTRTARVGVVAA